MSFAPRLIFDLNTDSQYNKPVDPRVLHLQLFKAKGELRARSKNVKSPYFKNHPAGYLYQVGHLLRTIRPEEDELDQLPVVCWECLKLAKAAGGIEKLIAGEMNSRDHGGKDEGRVIQDCKENGNAVDDSQGGENETIGETTSNTILADVAATFGSLSLEEKKQGRRNSI